MIHSHLNPPRTAATITSTARFRLSQPRSKFGGGFGRSFSFSHGPAVVHVSGAWSWMSWSKHDAQAFSNIIRQPLGISQSKHGSQRFTRSHAHPPARPTSTRVFRTCLALPLHPYPVGLPIPLPGVFFFFFFLRLRFALVAGLHSLGSPASTGWAATRRLIPPFEGQVCGLLPSSIIHHPSSATDHGDNLAETWLTPATVMA